MDGQIVFQDFDPQTVGYITTALCELYRVVYAESPYLEGEDDVTRFAARLDDQRNASGFLLTSAWRDDQLIGYLYGFTVHPRSPMWRQIFVQLDVQHAHESFACPTGYVSELLVLRNARRQGVARALHDRFLAARPERQMALLVHPEATPAQAAYASWGWRRVGCGEPFPGAVGYQTMMLFR